MLKEDAVVISGFRALRHISKHPFARRIATYFQHDSIPVSLLGILSRFPMWYAHKVQKKEIGNLVASRRELSDFYIDQVLSLPATSS